MAQTSTFAALEARVRQLEFLLPTQSRNDDVEEPEQQQQDKIRAFLLLCHAEVESFVEDLARRLGDSLTAELANHRAGTRFGRRHAEEAKRQYLNTIYNNHGVKESNLLALFESFGLSETTFECIHPDFLSEFNSYGTMRGDSAHQSAARITRQLNARNQLIKIRRILGLLERFEMEVNKTCLNGLLSPNAFDIEQSP
ncbi:HEPN domain-containing protein [Paraburkholderia atlantica]|uniref:HEPN domain-containing protein n=1 Tax=Paraburkholderia atlantica TaxID=2654982 RepID=UPI0003793839|nr:HEPN domain-containing protein [Paraburkholderia atlantica]